MPVQHMALTREREVRHVGGQGRKVDGSAIAGRWQGMCQGAADVDQPRLSL